MGDSLIQLPTVADIPPELRPKDSVVRLRPEVPDINRASVPQAEGWRLIVLPVRAPRRTSGEVSIELAPDTVRHLDLMRTIGVVLNVGPLAWSEFRKWPETYRDVVLAELARSRSSNGGDAWILFHAAAGLDIRMQSRDGSEMVGLKVIDDSSVISVFETSEQLNDFLVLI